MHTRKRLCHVFDEEQFWLGQQSAEDKADYWNTLMVEGVVSVPIVENDEVRRTLLREVEESVEASPELKPGVPSQERLVVTLGGFGALGTASSFHFPIVRKLRGFILTRLAKRVFRYMPDNYYLEPIPDRLCMRVPGQTPGAEKGHRDVTPDADATDYVTGGWLNLSDSPQYFSCLPRSQYEPLKAGNAGFLSENLVERLERTPPVVCPSGHFILFNQHIGHQVNATPAGGEMVLVRGKWTIQHHYVKLFMGFRMTRSRASLMDALLTPGKSNRHPNFKLKQGTVVKKQGDTYVAVDYRQAYPATSRDIYLQQGIPLLPSGQDVPQYSPMHSSTMLAKQFSASSKSKKYEKVYDLFIMPRGLESFSERFIDDIPRRVMGAGKSVVVPRFFPSLEELGKKLPDYSESELEVAAGGPRRKWANVHTLDSQWQWIERTVTL